MSFKVIIITSPNFVKNEVSIICSLFEAGLKTLHLRKPSYTRNELKEFIESVPKKFHKHLVLHSHYSLCKKFKLKGIHLTEKSKKNNLPDWFNTKKFTLSASFHSIKALELSKRKYNYVFLSPVFNSISKKNYSARFQDDELSHACKKHKNLIALGGIDVKTIKKVKHLGFNGAAALGYIWESKNSVSSFKKLVSKIK